MQQLQPSQPAPQVIPTSPSKTTELEPSESTPSLPKKQTFGQDPRAELNQYRQNGVLQDFGYHLLEVAGQSHQPLFTLKAWAFLSPEKGRIEGEKVQASSKKEAQLLAAQSLILQLHHHLLETPLETRESSVEKNFVPEVPLENLEKSKSEEVSSSSGDSSLKE